MRAQHGSDAVISWLDTERSNIRSREGSVAGAERDKYQEQRRISSRGREGSVAGAERDQ